MPLEFFFPKFELKFDNTARLNAQSDPIIFNKGICCVACSKQAQGQACKLQALTYKPRLSAAYCWDEETNVCIILIQIVHSKVTFIFVKATV